MKHVFVWSMNDVLGVLILVVMFIVAIREAFKKPKPQRPRDE